MALPTYPVGAENYLNGGDIFGMSESFNAGGDVPPTPSPTQSAISGVTINGGALASSGSVTLNEGNNAAVISIQAGTDGASYGVAVVDPSAAVGGNTIAAGQQTAVAGSSVNLNITGVVGGTAKKIVLCRANVVTQVWGTLNQPSAQPSEGHTLTISSMGQGTANVSLNGVGINSGATIAAGQQVDVQVYPYTGATPSATINGAMVNLAYDSDEMDYKGSFQMPDGNSTLVINTGSSGGDSSI